MVLMGSLSLTFWSTSGLWAAVALRIVSLSPAATEALEALGQSHTLVGVSRYDRVHVLEGQTLPRMGGLIDPNLEAIAQARPDLILATAAAEGALAPLKRLGLQVELLSSRHYTDIKAMLWRLGALLGQPAQAETLWRSNEAALEAARQRAQKRCQHDLQAQTQAKSRPRVVFVVGLRPLVVAGPTSHLGVLLEAAGANNVVPQGPPTQL